MAYGYRTCVAQCAMRGTQRRCVLAVGCRYAGVGATVVSLRSHERSHSQRRTEHDLKYDWNGYDLNQLRFELLPLLPCCTVQVRQRLQRRRL